MADNAQAPKRGLTRPIEVVRAELLKDPEIARIAQAAGMELAAFVEKALEYAQDKDKEPVFNVADDEELKAAGFNVPSEEEVAKLLVKVAKGELGVNEEYDKSEFTEDKGSKGPSLS
jgi:hypothetical protein